MGYLSSDSPRRIRVVRDTVLTPAQSGTGVSVKFDRSAQAKLTSIYLASTFPNQSFNFLSSSIYLILIKKPGTVGCGDFARSLCIFGQPHL